MGRVSRRSWRCGGALHSSPYQTASVKDEVAPEIAGTGNLGVLVFSMSAAFQGDPTGSEISFKMQT
jgi:hypothetical protein